MKSIGQLATGATLLALAVSLLAGCGRKEPGKSEIVVQEGQTLLEGAGATFPAPLYQNWFQAYRTVQPDVVVTYEAVGSGAGVKRFLEGSVDFGASDAAMKDEELAKVDPAKGALMIPVTAGMVVLAYNIPGFNGQLKLRRDVYTDIFAGKITEWNDPEIVKDNPGLESIKKGIVTVGRRDSSGTTFAITNHLSAISEWWENDGPGTGKLVDWPGNAMTTPGNEGVAARVKITQGSIGYMEYEFAERLNMPIASLENRHGEFVMPSPESGQLALAPIGEAIPVNLRVFLPDPDSAGAYPIVTYSWLLLQEKYTESDKARALRDLVGWTLAEGQETAEEMGYVPLPGAMVEKALAAAGRIQ